MGAYEASLKMNGFLGLYQDGDGVGIDPRYALEAINIETEGGVLASAARPTHLRAELGQPIGTLMRLHRRFRVSADESDVLVAASGGKLFWMLPDGDLWMPVQMPDGVEGFQSDRWSWVAYEMNPDGSDAPVDILLLSNAMDGMYCVRGDTLCAEKVETPKRFGVISRYAERIWGGAVADDPDVLCYSAPFDPFDWAQNSEIPEDGAGDIRQPSWDGDSFTALMQFGAQLIAFKKHRIWRILGTDPGEYIFREQYGSGAEAADAIAVDGERILMLSREGALQYDGLSAQPFCQPYVRRIFERLNKQAFDGVCACMHRGRYYAALPLDGSPHNNAVLTYNTREATWLLREGMTVKALLSTDQGLFYTSATEPGRVWKWGESPAACGAASPARWVGPWQEPGGKSTAKGGFAVYLSPEVMEPMDMRITLRTEKKARAKLLRIKPGGKTRRVVFGGGGRKFRLEIETTGLTPWKLPGGVQINMEINGVQ